MSRTGWLSPAAVGPVAGERRIGGALGVSVLFHGALLLGAIVLLTSPPAREQLRAALEQTKLVYVPQAGLAGGGGGNPRPTPPRQTEIPRHELTRALPVTPATVTPVDPPPPVLNAPIETNAATLLQVTGTSVVALPGPGGGGSGPGILGGVGSGALPGRGGWTGDGVHQVGGDVTGPDLLRKIEPLYTQDAMVARAQGTVEIEAVVRANGTVGAMRIRQGLRPDLDRAAMAAAREWLFRPGRLKGVPVDVLVTLVIDFRLR